MMCCGGRLGAFHVPWDQGLCCNGEGYVDHAGECCEDGQLALNDHSRCCNGKRFYLKHYPQFSYTDEIDFCCGEGIYDPLQSLCCSGNVISLSEEAQKCCGSVAYNPNKQICCSAKIHTRLPLLAHITDSCGDQPFDPNSELCCNGTLSRIGNDNVQYKCCETIPIISDTQECCNGKIYEKIAGFVCCGSHYYNPSDILSCCSDQLYDVKKEGCCSENTKGSVLW
jgi:hypothetical protein